MEFHTSCNKESNDRKTSKANTGFSPQPKQKKLGSILNFDKCERTYDDFHPQVLKNAESSKPYHHKQQGEMKSWKSEELVMYMSCLPSYLERGEAPQEKPFNIGVLDWCLLQKWQHGNGDIAGIKGKHSPSTSNTIFVPSKESSFYCGSQPSERDGTVSGLKGNVMIQKGEASKAKERLSASVVTDRDFYERQKAEPDSRNDPVSRHVAAVHQSGSSIAHKNRSLEENRYTFNGGSSVKVCHTTSVSDYTRFYSVASEHGKTKDFQVGKSFVHEVRSVNCPSGKEQIVRFPESASICASKMKNLGKDSGSKPRSSSENETLQMKAGRSESTKVRNPSPTRRSGTEQTVQFLESASICPSRIKNIEKNSGSKPRNSAENEKFQMKVGRSESTKVRNPSPTRRFSFGMGRLGKSFNSKISDTENLVSENIPDSKVASTSACSTHLSNEKSNAASRARSSPLRRLLDPILKPERNSSKTDKALKPGQTESAALHSVGRRLDLNDFGTDISGGPHHPQKNGASSMQALLQVAMKNGLPLFTFTVDKLSEILAATVKEELSSNKTARGWIYTFFSFSETKKKNNGNWINQGSKDRNHGYVPTIVAQMKVSDIGSSGREFVLSSVGVGDVDQALDSFPGDELAAIVVKFPNSGDGEGNESANHDLFSTTVILPGGHHGAPSKGEPSPLIERWKSGGLCDCGGWDLGCRLRILANNNQSSCRFESTKSQLNPVRLFSQEEVEDERPAFIFSPFEDGIFSVEFSSSLKLKLIQAFSIGIAVLHNRASPVLSSNTVGGKMSEEIMASENTLWKSFNEAQVEVSAKYATNPPLSPVGRV